MPTLPPPQYDYTPQIPVIEHDQASRAQRSPPLFVFVLDLLSKGHKVVFLINANLLTTRHR